MADKLSFDAIVVGGGPAGVAAAISMAKGGLSVVLIERGRFAGAKNFFGGVLYTSALAEVLPDYYERKPPFERPVTEQGYLILAPDSVVRFTHKSQAYKQKPAEAYTALRARFDPWFAQQAAEAGVLIVNKTTVADFIRDGGGRVVGVKTDRPQGDIYAPIVIVCEGVNNLLTQKLGFAKTDLPPKYVALSVKETIGLPAKEIETRFGLSGDDEGVALDIYGDATLGLPGTAFMYTDRASISIGLGLLLDEFVRCRLRPYDLMGRFKAHPMIRPYIEGGELLEYGAHLIPEMGYDRMPELCGDGVMIAGDAAGMVDALYREGTNLAMTAGRVAGETALEAHRQNDFTGRFLKQYRHKLEETFVLKDLKQYRRMTDFLGGNREFLGTYTTFVNDAALKFFTAHDTPKAEMVSDIFHLLRDRRSFFGVAQDMFKLLRAIRG
jgi:electron transfer flavoprotein-quinone oxidoreductase